MIVGYMLLGSIVGLIASIASLIAGGSLWFAIAVYSLAGASTMILVPTVLFTIGALATHLRRQDKAGTDTIKANLPTADTSYAHDGSEDGKASRRLRILAVDDDPFILGLIPVISAKAGFPEVTAVASARLAIDKLAQAERTFDCLLLDVNMPEMDGIELCRRVRGLVDYKQTPIIMLTGKRDMRSMDLAFQAGATDYATKPFDVVEFGERLRLVKESIEARDGTSAGVDGSAAHSSNLGRSSAIRLLDEVQLDGLQNVISRTSLVNYVTGLPNLTAASVRIIAAKVDCTDLAHTRTSFQPFMSVLRGVAVAASNALGSDRCMMAYAGEGIILIVTDNQALPTFTELEAALNRSLTGILANRREHDTMVVNVSVGRSVQPDGTKARRAEVAFGRAIGSAHNRALERQSRARPNYVRLIG